MNSNYFRYSNQKCPVCSEAFKNDDDIVVCPVCGTPHHRECYKKNGECGNYDKHQDGFRWAPEIEETPPTNDTQLPPSPQNNIPYGVPPTPSTVFFGGQSSPFALFPKEVDDGVDTEEAAEFVQASGFKYIQKFFYVKSGKKTFNWGAFLLGPFWFFYRKMHKIGVITLALLMFASVACSIPNSVQKFNNDIYEFEMKYGEISGDQDAQALANEITSDFKNMFASNKLGSAITVGFSAFYIALHLVLGLKADKWYYNHTLNEIKKIKKETEDVNQRKLAYFNRGGVAVGYTILAVLANSILPEVAIRIIFAVFK
jgi:hypothetical protein